MMIQRQEPVFLLYICSISNSRLEKELTDCSLRRRIEACNASSLCCLSDHRHHHRGSSPPFRFTISFWVKDCLSWFIHWRESQEMTICSAWVVSLSLDSKNNNNSRVIIQDFIDSCRRHFFSLFCQHHLDQQHSSQEKRRYIHHIPSFTFLIIIILIYPPEEDSSRSSWSFLKASLEFKKKEEEAVVDHFGFCWPSVFSPSDPWCRLVSADLDSTLISFPVVDNHYFHLYFISVF